MGRVRSDMPADLLEQTCRRVGIASLVFAGIWAWSLAMSNLAWRFFGPQPSHVGEWNVIGNPVSVIGLGLSLGMVFVAGRLHHRPEILLDVGLAFEVATCALIGAANWWFPVQNGFGVSWICIRTAPRKVDRWFRRLQLASAAAYSIGHGSNDAQKTMGIIWLLLIAAGVTTREHLPYWVIVSCYVAIALGTMFGGWRIVKTMGQKITKLRPQGGFAAETGGAVTLFLASSLGIPVSTTHTITGAIVGVGAAQRVRAVRWGVAGNIVVAWIVTMPAAALIAVIGYWAGKAIL